MIYLPTKGLIMETIMSGNKMFCLVASMIPNEFACFQNVSENESYLWNFRFGHLSYQGLRTFFYKKMVNGLSSIQILKKPCTKCLTGKQHRDSISKKTLWRASYKLQLVHATICGPVKPESNSNKRYFRSFIDDFTRKAWIYFLHE